MTEVERKPGQVVVRMAPSPTGNLHIGTARTTLFNYLFSKKMGGIFILRIEDTDTERSTKEFEQNILDGLSWLGLSYDEFYRQSERTELYRSYVQKMIDNGSAYISKEEPKEEGQRGEVVRFKNPNKKIVFEDMIRGSIEFDTTELGDFVIARSAEEPLYHLAVVIDDYEMGVTHVIRGEDHISNTPRQILIQEGIGAPRPTYAHIPLIFDDERKKLSKRKHGAAVWVDTYKEEGYLPDAIINYLAFLGWNPGTDREIYSLKELTEVFDIAKAQKGAAIFDVEKLKWMNKEHMKLMPLETIKKELRTHIESADRFKNKKWGLSDDLLERSWQIIFERLHRFGEARGAIEAGEFDFLFETPDYSKDLLFWKGEKDIEGSLRRIKRVLELIEAIPDEKFTTIDVKESLWDYATEEGRGQVLWPTRVALSGKEKSPDPFVLAHVLGKKETVERLNRALDILSS